MIGAGVFTSLGFQTLSITSPFALISLWFVGGVIALCGALSYGELASSMPHSGGEFYYLSKIYHPFLGFLSGFVSSTVAFSAPIALASRLAAEYICYLFPVLNPLFLACSMSLIITLIHIFSISLGSVFQDSSTLIKILLMTVFILCGLMSSHHVSSHGAFWPESYDLKIIASPAFAVSLVFVMYAYSGWNSSIYIADEIKNPKKTVPISLIFGTIIVLTLYVLTNYVILLTTPMASLQGALEVGFLSARSIFGSFGSQFMSALLAVSLISSVSSMVWTGPRVTQAMSEKIRALKIFSSRDKKRPPVKGLILQLLFVNLMLVTSTFKQILTYIGFTITVFSFLAVLGVFVYRYRFGKVKNSYTTLGYPVTPIIFLLGSGWMMAYLLIYERAESLLGLLTLIVGAIFYVLSEHLEFFKLKK